MKYDLVRFLQAACPFLLAIGLWRLSVPFWNPGGVLAIIVVFYCSFVKHIPWFGVFSVLMCMLVDYKFETVCFWLVMYCLFYSVNGFQNLIDVSRMEYDGLPAFAFFCGISIIALFFMNISFINVFRGIWMFLWLCALYIPIVQLIKKVQQ